MKTAEFQRLRYYDLKTKKFTVLTSDINWDVESFTLSEQGDKLAFTVNEDGMAKLYMLDTKTMKYSAVPKYSCWTGLWFIFSSRWKKTCNGFKHSSIFRRCFCYGSFQ